MTPAEPGRFQTLQPSPASEMIPTLPTACYMRSNAPRCRIDGTTLYHASGRRLRPTCRQGIALAFRPAHARRRFAATWRGTRLHGQPRLTHLTHHSAVAARYLGGGARPVRAILFDKTPQANWSLGRHQDRTIAVCERRAAAGRAGFASARSRRGGRHCRRRGAMRDTDVPGGCGRHMGLCDPDPSCLGRERRAAAPPCAADRLSVGALPGGLDWLGI